jgi:hypothetical protein
MDPDESWLEKWLLHEATEVYNYLSCAGQESNTRLKSIWERFVDYELGQLHYVMQIFKEVERRDPAEVLPKTLPEALAHSSHRDFVRQVLNQEVDLRAMGTEFIDKSRETPASASVQYRKHMNSQGSPSEAVAAGYQWQPGTELAGAAS